MNPATPDFIADAMLARLARWLRALGYSVLLDEDLDDHELAHLARTTDRILLTRDRRLCEERGDPAWCVLLSERKPRDQLLELNDRLGIFTGDWRSALFSRCMECGATTHPAAFPSVQTDLPTEVRRDPRVRSAGFRRCPGCDRVYWEGSHTRRMRRWLESTARAAPGEASRS
jgi:uncharacterized protein with PIN domain